MLKKRSIKTKMTVVGSLVFVAVILLGVSGFWGLYGYRDLAHSISNAAEESSLAQHLTHESATLCASHGRIAQLDRRDLMIEPEIFRSDWLAIQRQRFNDALDNFEIYLIEYETRIARTSEKSLLTDDVEQRESLRTIREAFDRFQDYRLGLMSAEELGPQAVSELLQELSISCEQHSLSITARMEQFGTQVRGSYRAWITAAWVCSGISMLLLVLLVIMFHRLIVSPFNLLLEGSRLSDKMPDDAELDLRYFAPKIYLGTNDELDELAESFNAMGDRFKKAYKKSEDLANDLNRQVIERSNEVIRNEQLASVGHLAAGLAHEINSPLQGVDWAIKAVQEDLSEAEVDGGFCRLDVATVDDIQETLRRIAMQSQHCAKITRRLVAFSSNSDPNPEVIEVNGLVNDTIEMLKTVNENKKKNLESSAEDAVFAYCNIDHIRQVMMNLISNALHCIDDEGTVQVRMRNDDGQAVIDVIDDGCGMDEHTRTHLFEPFFTKRRDGTGTGLGLSICSRIVAQYGGSLTPFSEGIGKGSRMELRLPEGPADASADDPYRDFREKQDQVLRQADAA